MAQRPPVPIPYAQLIPVSRLIDSSKGNPPGGVTPEAQMLQNLRKLQLSEVQRDGMRAAGRFNAQLMDYLRGFVKAGISPSHSRLPRIHQKLLHQRQRRHLPWDPRRLRSQGW